MNSTLKTVLVLIGVGLAVKGVVTWNDARRYNGEFRTNFTQSCFIEGGTASQCACYFNKLHDNYTYKEAVELDNRAKIGDIDERLYIMAQSCI